MRDKRKEPLRLEGKTVVLEEIAPKYFSYVVAWRNNKKFNRFLNQPFVLTEEREQEWYERVYLGDHTQGLIILLDRMSGEPFGTLGWTHMDEKKRQCVMGRLLVGNLAFRGSLQLAEGRLVLSDYLYSMVDITYGHVVKQNRKVISLNKKFGSKENTGELQYPEECFVNGMELIEFFRTKEMYETAKKKVARILPALF